MLPLSVKETERKQLVAWFVPAVSMIKHTAQTFKVTARSSLSSRVIHDVKEWRIIAGAPTPLHYAEELLGNTPKAGYASYRMDWTGNDRNSSSQSLHSTAQTTWLCKSRIC